MSDDRATPTLPTEEGCAGWTAKMGNSAEVIKKIKWNNYFDRHSPEPDSTSAAELPQPIFREVPVHVTRAQNRSVQTIPPPSAQPQAPPSRRKDEGRRRPKRLGGNGDGDGSDSDSGGDERRNGRHSPDGPLQRRKPLQPQAEPSSQDTPRLKKMLAAQKPLVLSPEEEERVQSLKRLYAFEKTLGDRLELRHLNRAESERKRRELLQERIPRPFGPFYLAKAAQSQAYLDEYLDESLYSAIVDDRLGNQIEKLEKETFILDLIAETEAKVTKILQNIHRRERGPLMKSKGFFLRINVYADEGSRGRYPRRPIWVPYPDGHSLLSPTQSTVPIPEFSLKKEKIYPRMAVDEDPFVSAYLDIITEDTPDRNIEGLPVLELLIYSRKFLRKADQLSSDYINWLRSRVGAATFDAYVARRRLQTMGKKQLEEFKEDMKAVNMQVSQEFFQIGSEVDLVLFKGGRPSTIKRVLPDDLRRMGWYQKRIFGQFEQQGTVPRYCRHAIFDDHPDIVFEVDMDGDILGVWGGELRVSRV